MPIRSFEMVIEPAEQDLFRWQSKELFQRLIFLQKTVQFRMKFDINLTKKSTSNNLPDQPENKMFPPLNKIRTTDIDDMSKTLCRVDDQVVVFDHLELTECFASAGFVKNTFINGLRSDNVMGEELHLEPSR